MTDLPLTATLSSAGQGVSCALPRREGADRVQLVGESEDHAEIRSRCGQVPSFMAIGLTPAVP